MRLSLIFIDGAALAQASGRIMSSSDADSRNHRLTPVYSTPNCAIWRCSCGTYHVQIGNAHLQMCETVLIETGRTLGWMAARATDAGHLSN